ncbi:MFS transporter [Candidatus Beckwithbacteria bacterium]|nr:MFS transporter [Candidatus Beckwithbacteria bacterium]
MKAHKNIILLSIFNFLLGFYLYGAIIVIYFSQLTGSYALAMGLFSITMIGAAALEIPTGIYSDLIGRRKTVILGSFAILLSSIFYAWGFSYAVLIIGALFEALSRAFFSGNNDALLYDSLAASGKEKDYDEYLGKVSSTEQAALAVSAVLGGIIAAISMKLVVWLAVIPNIFLVVIAFQLVDIRRYKIESGNIFNHLKEALLVFKKSYKLRLLSLASIIEFAFGETGFTFNPVFINSLWPLWAVGISRALSFAGGSISFFFAGKIIKKFKALPTLFANSLISRIITSLAILIANVFSPALMSMTSLLYGSSEVASNTLLQKEFTDKQRATLSSINSLLGSLAFGIISVLVGLIADKLNPRSTLLILQIFLLIPMFIYWRIFKHDKKDIH